MGPISNVSSGITPGPLHNILRAETFALLQTPRLPTAADVYIDNSTVVYDANDILTHGFQMSKWEGRADGDLWSLIAAELISRPVGHAQVFNVTAHSSREHAVDCFQQWLVAGNDAADKAAKQSLMSLVSKNNLGSLRIRETSSLHDAFVSSEMLHQLSLKLREIIKGTEKQTPGEKPSEALALPNTPGDTNPWSFQAIAPYSTTSHSYGGQAWRSAPPQWP